MFLYCKKLRNNLKFCLLAPEYRKNRVYPAPPRLIFLLYLKS